jgi:hypothetical protein
MWNISYVIWRHVLLQSEVKVTRQWVIKTYGITQLAKYVPGNFFHIAGRQGIGMAAGISAGVLVKSSICELGLIALAGLSYGWLVLPLIVHNLSILVPLGLLFFSLWIITSLIKRNLGAHILVCFWLQLLFLFISGAIFAMLLSIFAKDDNFSPQTFLLLVSSYIIAWLAGFLTPGAPAGVGIREWILLFLLKNNIAEADLIMVIVLGRAITVIGDFLFYCISCLIPKCKV